MIFSPVRVVRARLPSSSFTAYLSQILQLGSSIDITADIELDVMGDTKEAILEHQEQVSREKECEERFDELYARTRRSGQNQEWQAVADDFEQIQAKEPSYPNPGTFRRRASRADA